MENHLNSPQKSFFWKLLPTGNRKHHGAMGIPAGERLALGCQGSRGAGFGVLGWVLP